MKVHRYAAPIAAIGLAMSLIVLASGCDQEVHHISAMNSRAEFDSQFDFGWSGISPLNTPGAPVFNHYHGDHNDNCEGPTTGRTVDMTGTNQVDFDASEALWWCAPAGDGSGHVMTGVDTGGYNIFWFAPKQIFKLITKVCVDINQTEMSNRKWWQIMFVDARPGADATRFPNGTPTVGGGSVARGSGGYDLGFTSPEFRHPDAPSTGIQPAGGTLAGMKITNGGMFRWFHSDNTWTGETGWMPSPGVATADKATRYQTCIANAPNNKINITQNWHGGVRNLQLDGQIPQHLVRVVFQDDNYDPIKGSNYQADRLTLHWDNVTIDGTIEV